MINTLKTVKQHYALVVETKKTEPKYWVRGLFSLSQISKQLHMNLANSMTQADTVAELHKRHGRDE